MRVYSHAPPPAPESLKEEMRGTRRTARLGDHLHVVAVTAEPVEADGKLSPGTVYFYNLFFSLAEATPVPETADHLNSPNIFALAGATSLDDLRPTGLSYSIEHKLPGFSLPPEELNKLLIIHGSCRQPQGTGLDALPTLDEIISLDSSVADDRPHLLLLTGDQIYADDVAHSLLFILMEADQALLGWNERDSLPDVPASSAPELRPGKRKRLVRKTAAFTTEDPESHLLTL
ncbi:MAG TPA: PhoD-like phosphatase, partial [Blastocatellia bacterium]|nr:PhoD-like phosphatase [Blastocatellia bacterium]